MEPGKRLEKARKDAGYVSGRAAALAMGANYNTYAQHENGTRDISRQAAGRYARFFRVSLDWLLEGRGPQTPRKREVPVVAYVGAGAEIFPIDDNPRGSGLEMVDAPQGMEDCVAVRIRGESMHPLRDGWLLFYRRDQEGVPEECLDALCIVQVKDGPTMVKEVRKGAKRGRYRLESWNAPARDDQQLEWASKVREIRPR